MKIVVPMAGTGDRFVRKGYADPKPLIRVNGKMIIQYVCEMFDAKNDDFIFICNEGHLQTTAMRDVLKSLVSKCEVICIPNHKKGPVFTMASIGHMMDDEEEVVVCYCDNPYLWEYEGFKAWVKEKDSDGCILTHTGFHPHRLSPTKMAYLRENDLRVSEIKEKECYTDDPMSEHASTGTYYFKKGSYIKKYFQQLMDLNINYNGEYYVTLVYNLMIKDGLKIHAYPTNFVTVFGTPEEVENFEAWQAIISGGQVKNIRDVVDCYLYWRDYNARAGGKPCC